MDYVGELWIWLDIFFSDYRYTIYAEVNKTHNDKNCQYCAMLDSAMRFINNIYTDREDLKKLDQNGDYLVALCAVEKLLNNTIVHSAKENDLSQLKERISDVIYYFQNSKERKKIRRQRCD